VGGRSRDDLKVELQVDACFAGPIPIYHGHASATGKIPNQMTHVWMTKGPKMAWANCLPVFHLQQYNPVFKWTPDTKREHIGEPCK